MGKRVCARKKIHEHTSKKIRAPRVHEVRLRQTIYEIYEELSAYLCQEPVDASNAFLNSRASIYFVRHVPRLFAAGNLVYK